MIRLLLVVPWLVPGNPSGLGGEPSRPQATESEDLQRLNTERQVVLRLQSLEQNLRDRDEQGVREELRLLAGLNPLALVPSGGGQYEPLFRRVLALLRNADPAVIQPIAQEQQAVAWAQLSVILREQDTAALIPFLMRYPASDAACQAQLVIARMHHERGHQLAAAWWLPLVAHRTAPDRFRGVARRILDDLERRSAPEHREPEPGAEGRSSEPGTQLSPATNSRAVAWQHEISTTPELKPAVRAMLEGARQGQAAIWSAWQPLVTRDMVLVRTLRGVEALDTSTGDLLWQHRLLGSLLDELDVPTRLMADADLDPANVFRQLDRSPIADRLLRDGVTGRMSADDERLYVVNTADPSQPTGVPDPGRALRNRRSSTAENELVAIELTTGQPVWYAGGRQPEEFLRSELNQAWISGPPAVAPSGLYCLVEADESLWLACLEPRSGQLLWRRFLVLPESPVLLDPVRRLFPATPTVAQGIIYTQTTNGWVAAVDELTRVVLWAARCNTALPGDSETKTRGGQQLRTPTLPLPQSWRPEPLRLVRDSLIVCPFADHQLIVLDALTGQIRMQRSGGGHVALLHADPVRDVIILGGSPGVEAWSLLTGRTQWMTAMPDGCLPTGSAVMQDAQLLVPTDDDRVVTIDPNNGAIVSVEAITGSSMASGNLVASSRGLIRYGPLGLESLSDSSSASAVASLADVDELLKAGRYADADGLLRQMTPEPSDQALWQRLRFRALAGIWKPGTDESEAQLAELKSLADGAADQATIHRLQIEQSLTAGDVRTAVTLLSRTEEFPASVLNSEMELALSSANRQPGDPSREPSEEYQNSQQVLITLRSWTIRRLRQLLSSPLKDQVITALDETGMLTDERIRMVHHAALASHAITRARQALNDRNLSAQTLRLVRYPALAGGARTEAESEGAMDQEMVSLLRRARELQSRNAGATTGDPAGSSELLLDEWLAQALQRVGSTETPPPDSGEASVSGSLPTRLTEFWTDWAQHEFRVVSVSQSTSPQPVEPLIQISDLSDPLLSRFRWHMNQSPLVLAGRDALFSSDVLWCVPGGFTRWRQLERGHDELVRAGDTMLLITPESLAAVSIMDQRVLWSRAFPLAFRQLLLVSRPELKSFPEFTPDVQQRLLFERRGFRVCRLTENRLCIQSQTGIEVIDAVSGEPQWRLPDVDTDHPAFATDSVLLTASGRDDSVTAIRLEDAEPLVSAVSASDLKRTLFAGDAGIVVWRTRADTGGDAVLEWIDPFSGTRHHTVPLHDLRSCQRIDEQTLIVLRNDQSFLEIDLRTADTRTFSPFDFGPPKASDDAEAAGGPDAKSSTRRAEPGSPRTARDAEFAETQELVFHDFRNYYIVETYGADLPAAVPVNNHEMIPVNGSLRAVDRETGEFQWAVQTEETEYVAFDQPHLPMLILIRMLQSGQPNAGPQAAPPGSRNYGLSLRAIAKADGRTVFSHRTSSRWPWPSLDVDVGPTGNVDIRAFGSHLRFLPE